MSGLFDLVIFVSLIILGIKGLIAVYAYSLIVAILTLVFVSPILPLIGIITLF